MNYLDYILVSVVLRLHFVVTITREVVNPDTAVHLLCADSHNPYSLVCRFVCQN
jgi:hypothetical protein